MDNYSQNGFYVVRANCNFWYNPGFFKNEIIKLDNVEKEIFYCKNDVDYIKSFIDYIKERVIKKCKNLSSVTIFLATFDKNNIIHKMIVVIATMMQNLLQIKQKLNYHKSIIVEIEYEGESIFMGGLNFTGLD